MHALIDMDILCYEMGSSVDPEGFPLDWGLVKWRLDQRINIILDRTEATYSTGYLTSQDKSNFRYNIATIQDYKEHRKGKKKPYWYQRVYDYLATERGAVIVEGMEADDALSITQWSNLRDIMKTVDGHLHLKEKADTVLCTRDKDLLMVPGWHYRWESFNQKERGPWWIDQIDGLRSFYKQLVIGDAADNIHGLYMLGEKSRAYKKIDELDTELDMFTHVYRWYKKYYANYAAQFMLETGRLLWMKRTMEEDWSFPEGWEEAEATAGEELYE